MRSGIPCLSQNTVQSTNRFTVCEPNFLMRKRDVVHKYTRTNLIAMYLSVVGAMLRNGLEIIRFVERRLQHRKCSFEQL